MCIYIYIYIYTYPSYPASPSLPISPPASLPRPSPALPTLSSASLASQVVFPEAKVNEQSLYEESYQAG